MLWSAGDKITSARMPKTLTVGGSQAVVNSTTLVDSGLFFDVPANTWWIVEALLFYQSPVAANFKIGWSGPAGVLFNWSPRGIPAATDVAEGSVSYEWKGDIFGTFTYGGSEFCSASPVGVLQVGGTGGVFRLRFAQGTANATQTVLHPPSVLHLLRA